MEKTKVKKSATAQDMINALKEFLKEDLIGWFSVEKQGEIYFSLPAGKTFSICVKEVEN